MSMFALLDVNAGLHAFTGLSELIINGISADMIVFIAAIYKTFTTNPLANRLDEMTEVIRTIAEGEGNLAQRLDSSRMANDEIGDMGR